MAQKIFVDLYALLTTELSLAQMVADYQRKFGLSEMAHVLSASTYFRDADAEPTLRMLWRTDWRKIKTAIRGAVKDFVGREGLIG